MSRLALILALLTLSLLVYAGLSYASREPAPSLGQQDGLASWYGKEEQGKPTANGETFDRHELTAAHRHLPFNTLVRVTNKKNGRSVVVRINDRGPYTGHRILDVSEAAADTLDMKHTGVVPVKIEIIPTGSLNPAGTLP